MGQKLDGGVDMKLYESAENYLETILMLERSQGAVRSIDIAAALSFSKPSVSRAVRLLREDAYIFVDRQGYITLTDKGRAVAERILERHTLLTRYFVALGVDEATAQQDACRVEHDLSDITFEKIREHAQRTTDEA